MLVGQHRGQPQLGGALGADELFEARRRARHDQRRLVEGQDLAERVVAAHGDDAASARHQMFEPRLEGQRVDIGEPLGPGGKRRLALGQHKRPEHDERRRQPGALLLIGRQDPVDEPVAVAATARRDKQEFAVHQAGVFRGRGGRYRHLAA